MSVQVSFMPSLGLGLSLFCKTRGKCTITLQNLVYIHGLYLIFFSSIFVVVVVEFDKHYEMVLYGIQTIVQKCPVVFRKQTNKKKVIEFVFSAALF